MKIKKEAERVWFSLIFFFKSFLASLPFPSPSSANISSRGRASEEQGTSGRFLFSIRTNRFFCVCVFFFLFLEIRYRQTLPAEIIISKGKLSCNRILSLSVCPGSAKTLGWADSCSWTCHVPVTTLCDTPALPVPSTHHTPPHAAPSLRGAQAEFARFP